MHCVYISAHALCTYLSQWASISIQNSSFSHRLLGLKLKTMPLGNLVFKNPID